MPYRRNVDTPLRDLERKALQGDPDAKERLLRTMSRAGMIPVLKLRHQDAPPLLLDEYLRRIDVQHWRQYLDLITLLQSHQIPFQLRPGSPNCNCENQGDCLLHPDLTCYSCKEESMLIVPGKVSPAQPQLGQPGGYPVISCGNRHCKRPQEIEAWLEQGTTLEQALENFPEERELSVGSCSGFPWRAYENALGGLCDDCISRYPIGYHSTSCQCPICSEGIGPLILVPSRIVTPDQLQTMLVDYQLLFNDHRTVEISFVVNVDSELTDAWWNGPSDNGLRLDQYSMYLIEIRPTGDYRLRSLQHQNEKRLLPRFQDSLAHGRQAHLGPHGHLVRHTPGQNLFEYHMVGRDFSLDSLIQHLVDNLPPADVDLQYF